MSRYHLYAGYAGSITTPTPEPSGEEDMLDFQDIGGVYDDIGAAAANTTAMRTYLTDPTVTRPAIKFGGKTAQGVYNNKRIPTLVYFADGWTLPSGYPCIIDGGNCHLIFNAISPATDPCITVPPTPSSLRVEIKDMDIKTNGSGILLQASGSGQAESGPGRGTILRNISFRDPTNIGIACTGAGTVDNSGWTDLDTAAYAIKIEESDGCVIEDCSVITPKNYGLIIKGRLQAGTIRQFRVHGSSQASGVKAEGVHGSQLSINSESNHGYGIWMRRSGLSVFDHSLPAAERLIRVNDRPNVIDLWAESNGGFGVAAGGHDTRQVRLDNCGSMVFSGYNSWASNKFYLSKGTRNSNIIVQAVHTDQSVSPYHDMQTSDPTLPQDGAGNALITNFDLAWSNVNFRPTGTWDNANRELTINIPADCFGNVDGGVTPYYRPFGASYIASAPDGAVYQYDIATNVTDSNTIAYCNAGDVLGNSTVIMFHVGGTGGGRCWPGFYNNEPRKFTGRCGIETPTGLDIYGLEMTFGESWPNNTSPMTIKITDIKFFQHQP